MSALLVLLSSLVAGAPPAGELHPAAREAIVRAVRARLGTTAEVVVLPMDVAGIAPGAIEDAVIEPGATFNGAVRVLLRSTVERRGTPMLRPVARTTVRLAVALDHWHTAHAVTRGTRLGAADLRPVRHVLTSGALALPPQEVEVVGAAVLRDLSADACVTSGVVLPQPAVRAGDRVAAVVRLGHVEARTAVVAVDGGRMGATVRVRHPETKRTFSATVIGRGEVEVQR